MRPGCFRWYLRSLAPVATLAIAAVLVLCGYIAIVSPCSVAHAEENALTLEVSEPLLGVGKDFTVEVKGQVSGSLVGARLLVWVRGPVSPEQIGQGYVDSGSVAEFSSWLNTSNNRGELAAGELDSEVDVRGRSFSLPGAYLISAEVRSADDLLADGRTWMGMISYRTRPLDVSFVLPVRLGIHRDWEGRFFDRALEDATLPVESGVNTLRALAPVVNEVPEWRFSLAIEPIMLTQLRDMADGFVSVDSEGNVTEVGEEDLAAQSAAAALSDLEAIASRESVEVLASPYTGADLGLLAAEGWRDGLEAIQMGKQELQSTLGIETPLAGAYATDLGITAGSLSYYAGASVEHVVVGYGVVGLLAEMPAAGTVATRVENSASDRVTLVFASDAAGAAMREPWDASMFFAGFAADLASAPRDALIIAPKDTYGLIPAEYVLEIGERLTGLGWIRTQTLEDLLSIYPPDSRPVLAEDGPARVQGYIEGRIMDEVREAHGPVTDLGAAADPSRTPVSRALRTLYVAESGWWSRQGTSPSEASMGLAYARQARTQAESELSKLSFSAGASSLISAGSDTAKIGIKNDADYPIEAELRLSGEGLSFPDGERIEIELKPGRTDLEVRVVRAEEAEVLNGQLVVGSTVVDGFARSVSTVGLWTILPWVLAVVVLLIGVGIFLLVRSHRRARASGQTK